MLSRCPVAWILTVSLTFGTIIAEARAQVTVGVPSQVSVGIGGAAPAGTSGSPVAAPNGSVLVYRSSANNLVSGDTNNASDIFSVDGSSGAVTRISVSSNGLEANGDSRQPAVSPLMPDRTYAVAFQSTATNLVSSPALSLNSGQVYLKVFPSGQVIQVSQRNDGISADGASTTPSVTSLSSPARFIVAFASSATNLVPGDANGKQDIFIATVSLTKGVPALSTMIRIGSLSGQESNGDSSSPAISADGRYVVFVSSASNLLSTGSITGGQQVYLYDTKLQSLSLLSKSSGGTPGAGDSTTPRISYNGDLITFVTTASNVVSGASSAKPAIALYSRDSGVISRGNSAVDGSAGNGAVSDVALSANGRFITFSDTSSNLVSNDTNGVQDIFVKDLLTGGVSRASLAAGGSEANGASDASTLGSPGYNSNFASLGFRSFADNLSSTGNGSVGNVYVVGASLPLPVLTSTTTLDTPPDVTVKGRKAVVVFQQFSIASAASQLAGTSAATSAAATTVSFDLRLDKVGSRERIKRITQRNQIVLSKLPPGRYDVRYRTIGKGGTTGTVRTPFSPRQRIQITGNK